MDQVAKKWERGLHSQNLGPHASPPFQPHTVSIYSSSHLTKIPLDPPWHPHRWQESCYWCWWCSRTPWLPEKCHSSSQSTRQARARRPLAPARHVTGAQAQSRPRRSRLLQWCWWTACCVRQSLGSWEELGSLEVLLKTNEVCCEQTGEHKWASCYNPG